MDNKQDQPQSMNGMKDDRLEESPDLVKHTFQDGQLSYVGFDLESLPQQLIEDYCNVTSLLDLSYNKLRSLDGLEHFKLLKELVLDNNELNDSISFPYLSELHTLTLNKNKLVNLESLVDQLVEKFPKLTYLSILGNEACPNELSSSDKDDEDYQRYRYYVLYKLPDLKFLDSRPVTAVEVVTAKDKGQYMRVVRPSDDSQKAKDDSSEDDLPQAKYTPLPGDNKSYEDEHRGTYGKNKHVFYGNYSEGNIFIRNKDL